MVGVYECRFFFFYPGLFSEVFWLVFLGGVFFDLEHDPTNFVESHETSSFNSEEGKKIDLDHWIIDDPPRLITSNKPSITSNFLSNHI